MDAPKRDMSANAELFIGPGMDSLQFGRDTRWFERLDEAVRFAVQTMPIDRRYGAYIRTSAATLDWAEIAACYEQLSAGDAPPSSPVP